MMFGRRKITYKHGYSMAEIPDIMHAKSRIICTHLNNIIRRITDEQKHNKLIEKINKLLLCASIRITYKEKGYEDEDQIFFLFSRITPKMANVLFANCEYFLSDIATELELMSLLIDSAFIFGYLEASRSEMEKRGIRRQLLI